MAGLRRSARAVSPRNVHSCRIPRLARAAPARLAAQTQLHRCRSPGYAADGLGSLVRPHRGAWRGGRGRLRRQRAPAASPAASGPRRSAGQRLLRLSVPWLLLPPVLLILASEIKPVYVARYVVFCLPALALLAGAGLAALGRYWRIAALSVLALLTLPMQQAIRQPAGHGDDIRAAASVAAGTGQVRRRGGLVQARVSRPSAPSTRTVSADCGTSG